MTKKYILTLAISIGFFSKMEASSPEELEQNKASKGVFFYNNGKKVDSNWENKEINDRENRKNSFNSKATSPSIPINRSFSIDRNPYEDISKHELNHSVEEKKRTKISSIPKSPIISLKNSSESVSTTNTNAFTVGSPPNRRRVQKSSIEENKYMLLEENALETQKNPTLTSVGKKAEIQKKEKKPLKKKPLKNDQTFIFQFEEEIEETEKAAGDNNLDNGNFPSRRLQEITDSDSESSEDEKKNKFQNFGPNKEN